MERTSACEGGERGEEENVDDRRADDLQAKVADLEATLREVEALQALTLTRTAG